MARVLSLLAVLLVLVAAPAAEGSHVQTVRVGFAKKLDRPSMVGFVHG